MSGIRPKRPLVSTNWQDGDKYCVWLLPESQSHPVQISQDVISEAIFYNKQQRSLISIFFPVFTYVAFNEPSKTNQTDEAFLPLCSL